MRALAILALITLLLGGAVGVAESNTVQQIDIDYDGAWVALAEGHFQLYLPTDWMIIEAEDMDAAMMAVNADISQTMWIEIFDIQGLTLKGLYDSFMSRNDFLNVRNVSFNGVPFVCYVSPSGGLFGAVTFAADGSKAYFFKFMPHDNEVLQHLAVQILSSLSPMAE